MGSWGRPLLKFIAFWQIAIISNCSLFVSENIGWVMVGHLNKLNTLKSVFNQKCYYLLIFIVSGWAFWSDGGRGRGGLIKDDFKSIYCYTYKNNLF